MKRIVAVAVMVVLSGCATTMREVPQGPPTYQEGYAAGCNSGNVAAGHPYYRFTKDIQAYASDQLYKQGWDDGFQVCKGKYESVQRMMR